MKKWMTMLVLALVFFMAPTVSVKASGGDQPPGLYIDDERYLLNEMQEGAGWSYDGNYTLTLDGADLKKVDFQPFDEIGRAHV